MRATDVVSAGFMVLAAAIFLGYVMRKAGWADASSARRLMVWIQRFIMPPVLVISFWGMELKSFSLLLLPLIGLAVIFFQYLAAYLFCRIFKIEGSRRGAFLIGAILSNVGYIGWPLNLSLFGKTGFDYSFLYCFYFTFAVYFLAYPLAARYSDSKAMRNVSFLKKVSVEGILVAISGAILLGIFLNAVRIPMPSLLSKLGSSMIFAATFVMMIAVGWTLKLRSFKPYLALSAVMVLIKLIITPLTVAAVFVPIWSLLSLEPLMIKVIVIQSTMPLAISCLSVSVIFGLDQDFMNALWISTTLSFFLLISTLLYLCS